MKHPLEKERGKRYVGLPEFARVAEGILGELGIEQERGTVSLVPDERTIRYYLSEGLIQATDEKQGTASVFGYLHLLQLVAIKKLQAEHLPIRKIRELVGGKDEQELESLLGLTSSTGSKNRSSEAKRYLESLLTPAMSLTEPPPTRGPLFKKSYSMPTTPQPSTEQTASWQRVEIEPGLELHIRSDYSPPVSSARTKSLAERIRSAINRYWRTNE
jgi:DNA-binding transcriptional MerR regulator